MPHNVFTNTSKISVYVGIGIPQNSQSLIPQKSVALHVLFVTCRLIMLTAVQFDHKPVGCNVEINDIWTDGLLSVRLDPDGLKKSYQRCRSSFVISLRKR
jgi:hypothetical protein